jgi:hypothetical protein
MSSGSRRWSKEFYGALRLVLQHSTLAAQLVPSGFTVMTVELGCVDAQKHDRTMVRKNKLRMSRLSLANCRIVC